MGLFAFTLLMLSPLLLVPVDLRALKSPTRRAALRGLCLYIVMAASDGAFNFIPTMAFYWFVYMIFLFGWPGARDAEAPMAARLHPHRFSSGPEAELV
jgi:hypothetical protein